MKQLLQNANTGEVEVVDVPSPALSPGCVLVRIAASVVSAGTERASSAFASKGLLKKAIARPDLVQEVVSKIRRDGVFSAAAAVRGRLDQPGAPGYSSAGTVIAVSSDVTDIQVGDCVACAGAGYAVHAEFACVPRLLLARIPVNTGFEEAAFTTLGSVAMHGMRLAEVKLGETVAVIGLGLLGQLTVQLLKVAGCRVLGMDLNPARADLALNQGADAVEASPEAFYDLCLQRTSGRGADAVLIAAETASSAPVNLAAKIARDRAVITSVGTVGMDFERKQYFEKELDFRVSRSYGPGRYDTAYEQKGRDYPIGYVRWTETRNMEAFLALLAEDKLHLQPLISHRFPIERAAAAYELITGRKEEPFLGVLITYPGFSTERARLDLKEKVSPAAVADCVSIGVLGAGNFALNTLLPAIKTCSETRFAGICSAKGNHARHAAKKFGFQFCATDENEILNSPAVNAVVIATRHHLHKAQVINAHRAGKHVFCEKPLCLNERELAGIVREYRACGERKPNRPLLMVGFNRRFAPMTRELKSFLQQMNEPLALHYRVNAGPLPLDHWTNDPEQGGGRILGEVCHFVDLLSFLNGSLPTEVHTRDLANAGKYSGDNVVLSLTFANGSLGTITYVANGDRSFSKERLEVFGGGCAAVLEDFRRLELFRHGRKKIFRSPLRQDKGHRDEWAAFVRAIRAGGPSPISFEEIVSTTLVTLGAMQSRCLGSPIKINTAEFVADSLVGGYLAQEPVGT